jgi:hypothetical protein
VFWNRWGSKSSVNASTSPWCAKTLAYNDFKENNPIIEYQLRQKGVLAYAAIPYINDLTLVIERAAQPADSTRRRP